MQVIQILFFLLPSLIGAIDFISNTDDEAPVCAPLLATGFFVGGKHSPKVTVRARWPENQKEPFGIAIYNYKDVNNFGVTMPNYENRCLFCYSALFGKANCTKEREGEYLREEESFERNEYPIIRRWVNSSIMNVSTIEEEMIIPITGLYCARIVNPSKGNNLSVTVNFVNSYGLLSPEAYPILKASEILLFMYLLILIIWIFACWKNRAHLVSLQKYIGVALGCFCCEMSSIYLNFNYQNYSGITCTTPGYYVLFNFIAQYHVLLNSLFTSIRATAVLFLLLITSMGYGVVIASLEGRKNSVYLLAISHLIVSIINSLYTSSNKEGFTTILATIPLSITTSIFFSWIMNSLTTTKESLILRKQKGKLKMYQQLSWALYAIFGISLICMVMATFVVLSFEDGLQWYSRHWNRLWFYSVGWPLMLNFFGTLILCWIFRPQSHNRNYGLNELSDRPLDEDDLDQQANIALQSLRATTKRNAYDPHDTGLQVTVLKISPSMGSLEGHNRWRTSDSLNDPFAADLSDEDTHTLTYNNKD